MTRYRVDWEKTVYGYSEVEADNADMAVKEVEKCKDCSGDVYEIDTQFDIVDYEEIEEDKK